MGVGSREKVPDGEEKLFLGKSAFRRIARRLHAAQGQVPLNTKVVPDIRWERAKDSEQKEERPQASKT